MSTHLLTLFTHNLLLRLPVSSRQYCREWKHGLDVTNGNRGQYIVLFPYNSTHVIASSFFGVSEENAEVVHAGHIPVFQLFLITCTLTFLALFLACQTTSGAFLRQRVKLNVVQPWKICPDALHEIHSLPSSHVLPNCLWMCEHSIYERCITVGSHQGGANTQRPKCANFCMK